MHGGYTWKSLGYTVPRILREGNTLYQVQASERS